MVDILIAVLLGLITLGTAYLGLHVTLHPAESPRERLIYKLSFCVCAGLVCILSGLQAYRNNVAQTRVTNEINRIDENTPPLAAKLIFDMVLPLGNVQRFVVGRPASVNFYFRNSSVLELSDVKGFGDLSVGRSDQEDDIRRRYHIKVARYLADPAERLKTPLSLGPGQRGAYRTVSSDPLTGPEIEGLMDSNLRLYLNTYLIWKDRGQVRTADACYWINFNNDEPAIIRGRFHLEVCRGITE